MVLNQQLYMELQGLATRASASVYAPTIQYYQQQQMLSYVVLHTKLSGQYSLIR